MLHGEIQGFGLDGFRSFKGQYEHGIMLGEWNFFDSKDNLDHTKSYKLSDGMKEDSEEPKTKKFNRRFLIVQQMPEFPGGDMHLRTIIGKSVNYPKYCKENNIQGKVFVQFVVNKTGEIEQVKAVKKGGTLKLMKQP